MFEASSASTEKTMLITLVQPSPEVRFVSFKTLNGFWYSGMRLYDDDKEFIVDKTWNPDEYDIEKWTPLQEVPSE